MTNDTRSDLLSELGKRPEGRSLRTERRVRENATLSILLCVAGSDAHEREEEFRRQYEVLRGLVSGRCHQLTLGKRPPGAIDHRTYGDKVRARLHWDVGSRYAIGDTLMLDDEPHGTRDDGRPLAYRWEAVRQEDGRDRELDPLDIADLHARMGRGLEQMRRWQHEQKRLLATGFRDDHGTPGDVCVWGHPIRWNKGHQPDLAHQLRTIEASLDTRALANPSTYHIESDDDEGDSFERTTASIDAARAAGWGEVVPAVSPRVGGHAGKPPVHAEHLELVADACVSRGVRRVMLWLSAGAVPDGLVSRFARCLHDVNSGDI